MLLLLPLLLLSPTLRVVLASTLLQWLGGLLEASRRLRVKLRMRMLQRLCARLLLRRLLLYLLLSLHRRHLRLALGHASLLLLFPKAQVVLASKV